MKYLLIVIVLGANGERVEQTPIEGLTLEQCQQQARMITGDRHGEIVFTGPHVVAVCKQAK